MQGHPFQALRAHATGPALSSGAESSSPPGPTSPPGPPDLKASGVASTEGQPACPWRAGHSQPRGTCGRRLCCSVAECPGAGWNVRRGPLPSPHPAPHHECPGQGTHEVDAGRGPGMTGATPTGPAGPPRPLQLRFRGGPCPSMTVSRSRRPRGGSPGPQRSEHIRLDRGSAVPPRPDWTHLAELPEADGRSRGDAGPCLRGCLRASLGGKPRLCTRRPWLDTGTGTACPRWPRGVWRCGLRGPLTRAGRWLWWSPGRWRAAPEPAFAHGPGICPPLFQRTKNDISTGAR